MVLDTRSASRAVVAASEAAADLSPAWPGVGDWWRARELQVFARGGRPRWAPLSPSYILARRRHGLGGAILVRTGRLRDAVTSRTPARATARWAVFGPHGRQAPHWSLVKTGTGSMPRRDPMPRLTPTERTQVRGIVAGHLHRRLGRAAA